VNVTHQHNREIPSDVRRENDAYNFSWVLHHQLVGLNTISLDELDVDPSQATDSNPFMVVWLRNIDRLFNLLPAEVKLSEYSLVDVGCGSGISTSYIHKNYSLKKVIGFDFSSNLIDQGFLNKDILYGQGQTGNSLDFQVANATTFYIPEGKVILFLFNPFGWKTMKLFIENNLVALRRTRSLMLYANDLFINDVADYAKLISRDRSFNLSVVQFGEQTK
jgi:SAM-dependent methyltransferase